MIPDQPPPRPDIGAHGSVLRYVPPADEAVSLPDGRPKVTWHWWQALTAFFVSNIVVAQVLVGGLIVAFTGITVTAGPADAGVLGLTLVTNAVWVAGLATWLERRHPRWRDAIRLAPASRRFRELGVSFALGLGLYPVVAIGAGLIVAALLRAVTDQAVTAPDQIAPDLTLGGKLLAVVVALFAAPVAEEFFFRGVLFRSIRDRHGFWAGALSSSLVFGLVHYVAAPWPDAVFLQAVMVVTGVGLCLIYERRKSLVSSIAAHVAFNSIGIVLILMGG